MGESMEKNGGVCMNGSRGALRHFCGIIKLRITPGGRERMWWMELE
jgi:hypothetical protein